MKLTSNGALLGFALIPMGIAAALSVIAVGDSSFFALVLLNALVTYPVFILTVVAYGWLATTLKWNQSCTSLMLAVFFASLVAQSLVSYLSHSAYYDYVFESTKIVESGRFTADGIKVLAMHALASALKYSVGAFLFWRIRVRSEH